MKWDLRILILNDFLRRIESILDCISSIYSTVPSVLRTILKENRIGGGRRKKEILRIFDFDTDLIG